MQLISDNRYALQSHS